MKRIIVLIALVVFSVAAASAQQQQPVVKKAPKLVIPAEVRKSGYGGTVTINAAVDETGKVTSAEIAGGPGPVCASATRPDVDAMRRAARTAALRTTFSPATK